MLNAASIYGFVKGCLQHTFDDPQPIPEFHKTLWTIYTSEDKYVAISAPRGHAKSTATTLSYALASVLFQEASYVIIISDTESQSVNFLGDIKMQLIENEDIHALFGKPKFIKDSETNIVVEMKNGFTFRISAKGAGQRIRGAKWRNKRPDLIIVDDLEDDEAVESKDRRNKLYRWFTNAVLPALSDRGKIRVVGTILHMDSVLEKLLNKKAWTTKRYAAHNEDFSEILWPEKFNKERLEWIRASYIEDGNPAGYSQEYLSHPIDESTAYFRRDDLQAYNPDELDRDRLVYYAAGDLAISKADSADWSVFMVVGVDERNNIYIIDVIRGRWDGMELVERILEIQERYEPEIFGLEHGQIKLSIGSFLDEAMRATGTFVNLPADKLTPSRDKETRARSIQARIRRGTVFANMRADWYPEFETELITFPRGKHDDQVDAFAWIGLMLKDIQPGLTKREYGEYLEAEYWEEIEDDFSFGKNMVTGY